ncbi:E3 ubiquitin-protein ligase TRIM13-like isoform X2 [Macrobrachium nipponense]|uniref:E3 ubiquitin-protein ligase TRIM13-like isoform X2 n=1 Tax=Macrobrachium nipponense TaxID=159736 RepID=UPI0030C7A409
MDLNVLECGICNELYDEDEFRPRILPCSHTYCSTCIKQLISSGHLSCPLCREKFVALSVNDFMINRSLIDVVRQFAGRGHRVEDSRDKSHSRAEWVGSPKDFCKRKLAECEKERADVLNFIKSSEMLKGEALNLSKEFDSSFKIFLQDSKNESDSMTQRVGNIKKLIQSKLEALLIEEDNIKLLLEQQNLSQNTELLREVDTSVNKLLEHIKDERLVADKEITLMKQTFFRFQRKISVIQRAIAEEGGDGKYITIENLRKMSSCLREIIAAGKLFAIQDHQGIRSTKKR